MEDAVEKRHAEQAPDRAAIGLGLADQAGELTVELVLLGDDPAEHAVGWRRRGWWRLGSPAFRDAERIALCQQNIDHTGNQQDRRNHNDELGNLTCHALASAPFPKFVKHLSTLQHELRKQRGTSNSMFLVPLSI